MYVFKNYCKNYRSRYRYKIHFPEIVDVRLRMCDSLVLKVPYSLFKLFD